jgi:hypothetical protein
LTFYGELGKVYYFNMSLVLTNGSTLLNGTEVAMPYQLFLNEKMDQEGFLRKDIPSTPTRIALKLGDQINIKIDNSYNTDTPTIGMLTFTW